MWCLVATYVRGDMFKQGMSMEKLIIRECMSMGGKWVTKDRGVLASLSSCKTRIISDPYIPHRQLSGPKSSSTILQLGYHSMLPILTVLVYMLAMTEVCSNQRPHSYLKR